MPVDKAMLGDLVRAKVEQAKRSIEARMDAPGPCSFYDLICDAMDSPGYGYTGDRKGWWRTNQCPTT